MRYGHMYFYWKRRWKHMWRHLSIVVVALKTVVQSVRSNRWRFNFERGGRGGQINFLWKMAMIITITKASILIICLFPRGLLLTYPLSPPPINSVADVRARKPYPLHFHIHIPRSAGLEQRQKDGNKATCRSYPQMNTLCCSYTWKLCGCNKIPKKSSLLQLSLSHKLSVLWFWNSGALRLLSLCLYKCCDELWN